jgi:hypothetical protein
VKTLESKENKASKKMIVTHNSVFAAHRLQCRMTIHMVDIRHFAFADYGIAGMPQPRPLSKIFRARHVFQLAQTPSATAGTCDR